MDLVKDHSHLPLLTVNESETCESAFNKMQKYDISQIPVVNDSKEFTGSLTDSHLYGRLLKDHGLMSASVKSIMQPPFPVVKAQTTIDEVSSLINKENSAVLVMDLGGNWHIITKIDVIGALG
jgi:cystathionine beta-synthase